MIPSELSDFLQFAIENNFPVLIKGKPGIGKTDIVAQASQLAKAKLIISHPVVSDPTDYKGLPFAGTDGSAHFMPFGELNELIHATQKTIFFLDDLGQAPASVQAACMQLILARRINGHVISDNVTFIAATNRKEDRAGVSGLLEPVKSRFNSIVELEVDTNDWVQWALANNMPTELIAFVRFKPALLDDFKATKDLTNTPCPRTVAKVGQMQNANLPKALEHEVFKGAVGEGFATEYSAFLKIYRDLPSVEQVILNPKGTPVSKEPSVQYAIAGMLAAHMSPTNQEAMVTYIDRLPAEISVVTMQDAITRKKDLSLTRTFVEWSSRNGNLILR